MLSRIFVCVLHPCGFADVEHEGVIGNVSTFAVVMRIYAGPLAGFRRVSVFAVSIPSFIHGAGRGFVAVGCTGQGVDDEGGQRWFFRLS